MIADSDKIFHGQTVIFERGIDRHRQYHAEMRTNQFFLRREIKRIILRIFQIRHDRNILFLCELRIIQQFDGIAVQTRMLVMIQVKMYGFFRLLTHSKAALLLPAVML